MIRRLGFLVSIALRHIARRKRQTAVAVSGVAVGVGFFLAVSSLMVGSQNDFIRQMIDVAPHIIVSDELRSPPPQPGTGSRTGRQSSPQPMQFPARSPRRASPAE
jgi:lipoprotein-releasing system permease protein